MREQRRDGRDLVAGAAQVLAQEVEEGAQHRAQGQAHAREGQAPSGCLGEEDEERGAPIETVTATGKGRALPPAVVRRLAVVDHRIGNDAHLMPGAPRAPAQVQVVAVERQLRIEAAERVPDIASHEHSRGADRVDLAAIVMLALVMLPALEARDATSRPGDAESPPAAQATVRPAAGLRAEDGGPGVGVRGREEPLQAAGGRRRIVVEEPDPLGGLHVERLVAIGPQHPRCEARIDRGAEAALRVAAVEDDDTVVSE